MKGLADGLWRAEVEEGVEEEEEEEDGRGGGRWKMESTQPEQANAIIWDLENDPFPYLHNLIDR